MDLLVEVKQVAQVRDVLLRHGRIRSKKPDVVPDFGLDEKERSSVKDVLDRTCLRQAKIIWQRILSDVHSLAVREINRVLDVVRDDLEQSLSGSCTLVN